jgi:uncharacterized protein YlzI (FlbEa/FlbD family)
MARLLIVHPAGNGEELVLNADDIIWAERTGTAGDSRPSTIVTITNGKTIAIRETLNQLWLHKS